MKKIQRFITINQGENEYTFLPTGDIYTFKTNNQMWNQLRGNAKDGSVNNIWMRIYDDKGLRVYPLLGIQSKSRISAGENSICYEGRLEDIYYKVFFRPINNVWFWEVFLDGHAANVDFIYGQDIGVGDENSIYANELYISQYLGHSIFYEDNGYVVCSRQNMPSGTGFPYLQQGVLGAQAVHYSTDGLQFFGLSYKETGLPERLLGNLKDENLQYEFAYTALQTEGMVLNGSRTIIFYGYFLDDHREAVEKPVSIEIIESAYKKLPSASVLPVDSVCVKKEFGPSVSSLSFTEEEIIRMFPNRRLIERKGGVLYSFFTNEHSHIVTKEKELAMERPHGTIVITPPDRKKVNSNLITSTHYIYGVFNSHIAVGNTDMHKMLSTPRGFLNLLKNSGQRIYIRLNGIYHLLNMPGLFEMGMNYSRWYYKLFGDNIIITAYAANEHPDIILEAASQQQKTYDFIITNQITKGPVEYLNDMNATRFEHGIRFRNYSEVYPNLHYDLIIPDCNFTISDDRIFFEDNKGFDETFLTLSLKEESAFKVIIRGYLNSAEKSIVEDRTVEDRAVADRAVENRAVEEYDFDIEKEMYRNYIETITNHFQLKSVSNNERIDIINETVWWYTHNALIHYAMPHGLEQPGGAAWGTRDICQGPIEFFMTMQNYDLVRDIILRIFAHQCYESGEWPQWFMFDGYSINAGECHGDVVFWPLKAVADYLNATGDYSMLAEIIPYGDGKGRTESLLLHMKRAIAIIKETRMIEGTGLITYAGGDWDDTLQPADPILKEHLVSSWTVALAYQTFNNLAEAMRNEDKSFAEELVSLSELVSDAFLNILIKDDVPTGFLEIDLHYNYMLHPRDQKTGIHYRLLPLTRSIIAELVSKEQALRNKHLILEHLKCPDGVRLMDKPANYSGGVSRRFKRAEQAANVGREISLQYTHAHIRYIEAMAALGDSQEAWESLFMVNPVLIQQTVPNARLRQSNMYFSSSEGAYKDRYEYAEKFYLLKKGEIEVKGGWRLYSSGPGIYIRQLIGGVLGIRFHREGLIIDPILPMEVDGMELMFDCFGKTVIFRYHLNRDNNIRIVSDGKDIKALQCANPYRRGGLLITKDSLNSCGEYIDVYVNVL